LLPNANDNISLNSVMVCGIYPMCAKCKDSAAILGGGDITKDENVYIL